MTIGHSFFQELREHWINKIKGAQSWPLGPCSALFGSWASDYVRKVNWGISHGLIRIFQLSWSHLIILTLQKFVLGLVRLYLNVILRGVFTVECWWKRKESWWWPWRLGLFTQQAKWPLLVFTFTDTADNAFCQITAPTKTLPVLKDVKCKLGKSKSILKICGTLKRNYKLLVIHNLSLYEGYNYIEKSIGHILCS